MCIQQAETQHPVNDLAAQKLDYNELISGVLTAAPGIISAFNNDHPATPTQPPPGYYTVPPATQQQAGIGGNSVIWIAVAVMVAIVLMLAFK